MQEDAATYQYQYIYMRHQQHISTIKPAVIRDLLPDCQVPWRSIFANSQQKVQPIVQSLPPIPLWQGLVSTLYS